MLLSVVMLMVKIIKKPKIRKKRCKVCKTKYSYEGEDIKWYAGIYKPKVKCPVCEFEDYV